MSSLAVSALSGSHLSKLVRYAHDEEYKESKSSYWANQEVEVSPAGIIQPSSVAEVAEIIQLLSKTNKANGFSAPFALRSGGHQPWPGSANIEAGLTIDLRKLTEISVDKGKSEVTVGTGARWKALYERLETDGLTVPGARVAECGVTGLTLGGGISYLSPKAGFVCDNVIDFEVVLEDGSIVHANREVNGDLWRALKGGSNNFGVVTSMKMRTTELKPMWGGVIIYDYSTMPKQLEIFHRLVSSNSFDVNAALITSAGYHHEHGKAAYNSLKYSEPVTEPATFRDFAKLPNLISTMRMSNLKELVEEEGARSAPGLRRLFMTSTFVNDLNMLHRSVEIWEGALASVNKVRGIVFGLFFNPIVPAAIKRSEEMGGNCLGLTADQPLVVATLSGTWDDAQDDDAVVRTARQLFTDIDAEAKAHGVWHPYKYMNYAWAGQKVIDGYGEQNKVWLQEVSKKYDPHGVFQKAVPGGFKLFE